MIRSLPDAEYSMMQVSSEDETPIGCPTSSQRGEEKGSQESIEILAEGQECPFCHFAQLKREGDEIVCPVCGYGHRACT